MDIQKEMDKLAKMAEKMEALKDPSKKKPRSTGGIKTLLTEAEKMKRAEIKARKNFIASVNETKNEVLEEEVEDYQRILELIPITEKGIEESKEVISTYNRERALLEAQLYLLDRKMEAAQNDADVLTDALTSLNEFQSAVNDYALDCIEESKEFDADEIIRLWETMMTDDYVAALNRGTTTFSSLDWIVGLVKDEFTTDPDIGMEMLKSKVKTLFERYNIGSPSVPSEDI